MKNICKQFAGKNIEKLNINSFKEKTPDFKNSKINKDILVKDWLINNIKVLDLGNDKNIIYMLPEKAVFAYKLGVSIGTVQSAIRYLEDENYVISKQRMGTFIITDKEDNIPVIKSHSKKDKAYTLLNEYILSQKIGDKLPSTRILAKKLNLSLNTIRLAIENLKRDEIIDVKKTNAQDFALIINKYPERSEDETSDLNLLEQISDKLLNYIENSLEIGEKIPPHADLAKRFCTSIKTINDVVKNLADKGYLKTRRGRYGTVVIKNKKTQQSIYERPETSIFASASIAFEYNYQKIKNQITQYIMNNYEVGSKLPTIQEFSKMFDVSTNTIRKALNDLYLDGYIIFNRGRFGGTFVIQMPERIHENAFKWLAVSKQYKGVYAE